MEVTNQGPIGRLGIIGLAGSEKFLHKVDDFIREWRHEEDSFIIDAKCPRFQTGEAKGIINETVRGYDLFIFCDPFNHGVTYKMYGMDVPMSPDDYYQDLKRIINAAGGKERRTTVIMPMLYEGRQHRRSGRESLDCASMLQELVGLGVNNIITCDAHDARVANAIPGHGFDNLNPAYQVLKAIKRDFPDFDFGNTAIIAPDEGALNRSMFYSSVLGVDLGMFYKRRDYSRIIDGRNPIIAHEFLGNDLKGKNAIVIDDMISSGDSMIDITEQLKERGVAKILIFTSFGLFSNGLDRFDRAHAQGLFDKVYTTNLIYQRPELFTREWYSSVEMSKLIAYVIDTLNCDRSISGLLDPTEKINALMKR